ncbi:hypothetical protein ABZ484_28380 [Streptomyces sp. NPDC006393]|uniref:hypothetical protein n=1 Tax=Streptomyces sp. NPDC006393 TaxID=3156763 RepID=UPI0033C4749A
MAFTAGSSSVIVGAWSRGAEGSEGPHVPGRGQSLVLTVRATTTWLRPDAHVTGAAPAYQDAEGSAKDGTGAQMGANWENGQDNNMKYTRSAAAAAAQAHHLSHPRDVATWAEDESSKGYSAAGNYMERVAPELVTDI